MVTESSEFHSTLSIAHKAHFSNSKHAKKRDILVKSEIALKKNRELTPESGADTYELCSVEVRVMQHAVSTCSS